VLLIVTALRKEAEPFISAFHLKRDMRFGAFPVFENESVALILSGTGKLRAAIASTALLSRPGISPEDTFLCHFGFCGSRDDTLAPGSLVAMHKISDADTGRDYYPDYPLALPGPIPRAACVCVPRLIRTGDDPFFEKHPDAQVCDMESAGIMEAAGRYLSTRRVLILKVVSDLLAPEIADISELDRYLLNHTPAVLGILLNAMRSAEDTVETSDTRMRKLIAPISARLRLTAQMEKQLIDSARRAILGGAGVDTLLDASAINEPADKRERKQAFEQIIRRLRDAAVSGDLH
jgi:spore photoproduct lyase